LFSLHYLCDRLPNIFHLDWLQSHLAIAEHGIDWKPVEKREDGSEKRIIRPKHDRRADQNSVCKGRPDRQFALPPLSDIERLRAGIGTDPRYMDEPFDSGSLRLSCDPSGRLDVDGMKRFPPVLDVKADCVHRAVSIVKRFGN
jgi:hypothetical protein